MYAYFHEVTTMFYYLFTLYRDIEGEQSWKTKNFYGETYHGQADQINLSTYVQISLLWLIWSTWPW